MGSCALSVPVLFVLSSMHLLLLRLLRLLLRLRRIGVQLVPCLCKLRGAALKELGVAEGANELLEGGLLRCETVRVSPRECVDLEIGGLLGESLESIIGFLEIKENCGNGLREPGLISAIGRALVGGFAHWRSSRDTPVRRRHSTELSLAAIGVGLGHVAVLGAVVKIVLGHVHGRGTDTEGAGRERRGGGSRKGGDEELHGQRSRQSTTV
mmetsp:Transcript_3481/g.6081  ORF Transcript_3481/g.6081 Transcript_3481/m.6081 type:complete len:211 (-) Transcript_3481:27-659(-)